MTIDERLAELGIELPELPRPIGAYVLSVQTGNLLYTSGIGPQRAGAVPLSWQSGFRFEHRRRAGGCPAGDAESAEPDPPGSRQPGSRRRASSRCWASWPARPASATSPW